MKIIVRAFVLALTLTGIAATTQISSASTKTNVALSTRTSALPVPMCPPGDPDACGLGR
jgi:hypothetical protein